MLAYDFHETTPSLHDGLGKRIIVRDDRLGRVETLIVASTLATRDREEAIRSRVMRLAGLPLAVPVPVHGVERVGGELHVTSACINGLRLSTMLEELEAGNLELPDRGVLQLIARVFRTVADFHQMGGQLAHGALSPAHVVLTEQGTIALTDFVYGSALESLEWNREQLWHTFGLALPSAASCVRFDQRSDVTQLGALALALLLRRPVRSTEYPREMAPLVCEAAERYADVGSGLRTWLQELLQLHSRAAFASAVDASRALTHLLEEAAGRRASYHVIGVRGHRVVARVPSAAGRA